MWEIKKAAVIEVYYTFALKYVSEAVKESTGNIPTPQIKNILGMNVP
jgi:hypothetical protein